MTTMMACSHKVERMERVGGGCHWKVGRDFLVFALVALFWIPVPIHVSRLVIINLMITNILILSYNKRVVNMKFFLVIY